MFFLDKFDLVVNRALESVLNDGVRHVDVGYYLRIQVSFFQETLIMFVSRVQNVYQLCFQAGQTATKADLQELSRSLNKVSTKKSFRCKRIRKMPYRN